MNFSTTQTTPSKGDIFFSEARLVKCIPLNDIIVILPHINYSHSSMPEVVHCFEIFLLKCLLFYLQNSAPISSRK